MGTSDRFNNGLVLVRDMGFNLSRESQQEKRDKRLNIYHNPPQRPTRVYESESSLRVLGRFSVLRECDSAILQILEYVVMDFPAERLELDELDELDQKWLLRNQRRALEQGSS